LFTILKNCFLRYVALLGGGRDPAGFLPRHTDDEVTAEGRLIRKDICRSLAKKQLLKALIWATHAPRRRRVGGAGSLKSIARGERPLIKNKTGWGNPACFVAYLN